MKRPTFNENTEVKVIDKDYHEYTRIKGVEKTVPMYGWRGTVKEIIGFDADWNFIEKPYSSENYPSNWEVIAKFKSPTDGETYTMSFRNWPSQIEPVQHKFIDIDYIREEEIVLGQKPDGTPHIRPKNTGAFEVGDIIQISTKVDGANASISWDETTNKLEVFSRTNLLTSPGSLHGFYDYIKTVVEPKLDLSKNPDLVIFGEWCVGHSIKTYDKSWYNKWRIYDIWNKKLDRYMTQDVVASFCSEYGLEYIEQLYEGPFISWDHCRSFLHASKAYGPDQEGIVVKNQTKLLDSYGVKDPIYIKIVDEKFKEAQHSKKPQKAVDPEKVAAHEKAIELIEAVVTEARVRKMICKLMDEGQLPSEIQPKDMGSVMKLLPKATFDDIAKEEIETVKAVQDLGENIGKLVASIAAKHARAIVVGK